MRFSQRGVSAIAGIVILFMLVLSCGWPVPEQTAAVAVSVPKPQPLLLPVQIDTYITKQQYGVSIRPEDAEREVDEMKRAARDLARERAHTRLLASRSMGADPHVRTEPFRIGHLVAQSASRYIGSPYVWGGTNPNGFDCSGFTQYVYSQYGVKVPRNSYEQFHVGQSVGREQLLPGDLVFFTTYAPGPSHLGIYIGEGKFVHALNQETGVTTSELDADYYKNRYLGAKRVL